MRAVGCGYVFELRQSFAEHFETLERKKEGMTKMRKFEFQRDLFSIAELDETTISQNMSEQTLCSIGLRVSCVAASGMGKSAKVSFAASKIQICYPLCREAVQRRE